MNGIPSCRQYFLCGDADTLCPLYNTLCITTNTLHLLCTLHPTSHVLIDFNNTNSSVVSLFNTCYILWSASASSIYSIFSSLNTLSSSLSTISFSKLAVISSECLAVLLASLPLLLLRTESVWTTMLLSMPFSTLILWLSLLCTATSCPKSISSGSDSS